MRELSLVGLSTDGRHLIVRDTASGQQFRLRNERRLQALAERALGSNHQSGQLEIPMESTLTPREIQARIRRGESVDEVADAAATGIDQIIGFATPVLAEREHMADLARTTSVRRKHVSGTPVALGTLVDDALVARGIAPEETHWDSWRREDGLWTVQLTLPDQSTARFLLHPKSRYVLADEQSASDLVGDLASDESLDMAIADAVRHHDDGTKRNVADNEAAVEQTASAETSAGIESSTPSAPNHAPVHSLKEARDRRAMEQLAVDDEPTATTDDAEQPQIAVPDEPTERKKDRRRSVPSWDEIMFGGKRE